VADRQDHARPYLRRPGSQPSAIGHNQKRLYASILVFTQDMLFVDMTIAS
jgi:hypothetical protein